MFPLVTTIGKVVIATTTKITTKIIFKVKTYLFISFAINGFNLKNLMTKRDWAIISKRIKPNNTNLLKNLYKS